MSVAFLLKEILASNVTDAFFVAFIKKRKLFKIKRNKTEGRYCLVANVENITLRKQRKVWCEF